MVSVIIPTYGRIKDIVLRAVTSVEVQTYTDWELYVVDDNEDTETYSKSIQEAIEQKEDKRIHYIKMEKNSGACAARNKGIEVSCGEYVAFLDDDDEWVAEKLELQLPLMERKNVGFSYSGMLLYNELTGQRKSSAVKFKNGNIYRDLLKQNSIGGTPSFIIKREALEKCGGFLEGMPASQDQELWLRLAKEYEVASIPKDLIIVHLHAGDSVSKSLDRRIAGYRKIFEIHYEDITKDKEIYSYRVYTLAKLLILNCEYSEGIKLLFKSIKLQPLMGCYYVAVIIYWKLNYWIKRRRK